MERKKIIYFGDMIIYKDENERIKMAFVIEVFKSSLILQDVKTKKRKKVKKSKIEILNHWSK